MSDLDSIWAAIRGERLAELLVEAVDTYSPSYAEEPAMRVFAKALEGAGIPYLRQPVPSPGPRGGASERANLIVEMGPRPAQLMWVGHVDTIPAVEEEEPVAERHGDTLWGLGTADMKSGCAAIVEALAAIAATGAELKRGLAVALVVGEEEYGDGSETLVEHVTAPLTVIGEPTALIPCTDHYGYYEYRLTTRGAQAHAALPEVGASAIHAMLTWLTHMLEERQRPPYSHEVSVNPRAITGGAELFVVAERCEADVDVHTIPGRGADEAQALVDTARVKASATHPRCDLSYELVFAADGYAIAPDDGRLEPLRRACEIADMGWHPAAFRSHSDGSLFHRAGSLPVILGPGRLEVAHTRDENISLAETERAARLYAAIIHQACIA